MEGGLFAGAGVGFQEVVNTVKKLVSKVRKFRSTRRKLKSLVERVRPVLVEMKKMEAEMEDPKEETGRVMGEVEEAKLAVEEHSNVPWWKCCCLPCYQKKLQEKHKEVATSLGLHAQITAARDLKDTLKRVKRIEGLVSKARKFRSPRRKLASRHKEIKQLEEEEMEHPKEEVQRAEKVNVPWWKCCCLPCYQETIQEKDEEVARSLGLVTPITTVRDVKETLKRVKNIEGTQLGDVFKLKPPQKPDPTVGLDKLLCKLKIEVLHEGVSVVGLTGMAGSGKTTLATLLCFDQQVKGKFGDNILFFQLSKTPDLKNVVRTLFQRYGGPVSDFLSDEDMGTRLKTLLEEHGKTPMMVVLDNVWPGSESIIDHFKVQLPDYKVVVTSRVHFPIFDTSCSLEPLGLEDSVTLFCQCALPNDGRRSYVPDEDFVKQIARNCWGSPLAIMLIGKSLWRQPFEVWEKTRSLLSKGQSIVATNTELLDKLQKWLADALKDKSITKKCFMDLGLFPDNQKIPIAALIDMWTELYEPDDINIDDGNINGMNNVHELNNLHLVNLIVARKVALDKDLYYNNHFLTQHDLLRELAIHQSSQEPFEQRERLMIDLSGNNHPEWWVRHNEQGIISRVLSSFFPLRRTEQTQKQVVARTLSISTDETFTSDWCKIELDKAEVLILNIRSSKYSLPRFTDKMHKLKVLIVTNYGFHPSELDKFELLGYLPYLKRIRLEKVSVPCLCIMKSVQKLSLYMCNTSQAFKNSSILISNTLPNLAELNIDYCNDLVELPCDLCNITTLKKLSITSCHKMSALPQDIGKLENLEVLRLSSCSDLQEMPESVGKLEKLWCLDISDCVMLMRLPEDIGSLHSLKRLYIWGCSSLNELPDSIMKFGDLKHEICVVSDEEGTALWEHFSDIPNLKTEICKVDISLNWLRGVRS